MILLASMGLGGVAVDLACVLLFFGVILFCEWKGGGLW